MQYCKLLFLTIFFVSASMSFCKERRIVNNTDCSLSIKANYLGTNMFTPCSPNMYMVAPGKDISLTHTLQDCELVSIEIEAQGGSLNGKQVTVHLEDSKDKENVTLSVSNIANNINVHAST